MSQFGRESAFFLVIFGKLLRACFIVQGPAKLKIVRVRSVLNHVSVPGDSGEVCGKTVSQSESRKHAEFCRPSSPDSAFENVRDLTKSQLRVFDVSSINDLFA